MECPKCHAAMRSYERNGITVDQCTECRGVFLDRGELEHLISLEAAQPVPSPAPAPQQSHQQSAPYPQQGYPSSPKGTSGYGQ